MVRRSRVAVVLWAAFLSAFAILLAWGYERSANKNLIDLAFGMVAYTYGPLLGVLLAAILPGKRSLHGLYLGVAISVLLVAWIRPELGQLLDAIGLEHWVDALDASRPQIAFPWFYPVNGAITFLCSCLPLGRTAARGWTTGCASRNGGVFGSRISRCLSDIWTGLKNLWRCCHNASGSFSIECVDWRAGWPEIL